MQEITYQHSQCEHHRKNALNVCIPFLLIDIFFTYIQLYKLHVFRNALRTMLLNKQRITKKKILCNVSLTYFQLHHKIVRNKFLKNINNKSAIYLGSN